MEGKFICTFQKFTKDAYLNVIRGLLAAVITRHQYVQLVLLLHQQLLKITTLRYCLKNQCRFNSSLKNEIFICHCNFFLLYLVCNNV